MGNVVLYFSELRKHYQAFFLGGFLATIATWLLNLGVIKLEGWYQTAYIAVFLFFGIMFAGFRAWEEKHKELLAIASDSISRLLVAFDPASPHCSDVRGVDLVYRVRVVNRGRRELVKVWLQEIEPANPRLLNRPFQLMEGSGRDGFPLGAGESAYVSILYQRRFANADRDPIYRVDVRDAEWKPIPATLRIVLGISAEDRVEPFVFQLAKGADGLLHVTA